MHLLGQSHNMEQGRDGAGGNLGLYHSTLVLLGKPLQIQGRSGMGLGTNRKGKGEGNLHSNFSPHFLTRGPNPGTWANLTDLRRGRALLRG